MLASRIAASKSISRQALSEHALGQVLDSANHATQTIHLGLEQTFIAMAGRCSYVLQRTVPSLIFSHS